MKKGISLFQRVAWAYAAGFLFVVLIGHIPSLTDQSGKLLGFYNVSTLIDAVHFLAGLLGVWAAWHSTKWAITYLKLIAIPFGLDALISLFFSRDLLETFSIFTKGIGMPDFSFHNILANSPHIFLSAVAIFVGFYLSRKLNTSSKIRD